jgi:hydrogenase expression/formation protein HypC
MCLGVPGKILSLKGDGFERLGVVSFAGIEKEIALAFVPDAKCGDYVIVHVGYAISILDETEAKRTLALLNEVD